MADNLQKCSHCREIGHNKRTCPQLNKQPEETGITVPTLDNGTALSLVSTPILQKQVLHVLQKTPRQHIYTRPAKGGGQWDYVTGAYVKKVLNYTFGWMWDFQIVDKGREGDLVWVHGRLTIKDPKTLQPMITKEQFGRAEMKFKTTYETQGGKKRKVKTDEPLDYGNDLKAAATDALKKCASELGIASDVYAGNEFKDIQSQDKKFTPPDESEVIVEEGEVVNAPLPKRQAEPKQTPPDFECHGCAEPIDKAVNDYSLRVHGKPLCRGCQKTNT